METEGRDGEEVTSEDTVGGTTGATLEGKGAAAGSRGGMETWSIGGAVLGPGSKRPWRISENACCRLTADADIESPKAGGASDTVHKEEKFKTEINMRLHKLSNIF